MDRICSPIMSRAPAPIATITMTAATPIMIPSMVRRERRTFTRNAPTAIFAPSKGLSIDHYLGVLTPSFDAIVIPVMSHQNRNRSPGA